MTPARGIILDRLVAAKILPEAFSADVTRDGQRFLMVTRPEDAQEEPLTLVTNWPADLEHP